VCGNKGALCPRVAQTWQKEEFDNDFEEKPNRFSCSKTKKHTPETVLQQLRVLKQEHQVLKQEHHEL
jgi:hypothetical protein